MNNLDKAQQYILDCIDEDELNLKTESNPNGYSDVRLAKKAYLKKRFYAEYGWLISRPGETTFSAAREWLMGLALNTYYTYYDIATEYFEMDVNVMSEDEVYDCNDLYWDELAQAVTSLVKNY